MTHKSVILHAHTYPLFLHFNMKFKATYA